MEATKILSIYQDYLPPDKLKELVSRLSPLAEGSFQDTLKELESLLNPPKPIPPWWLKPSFYLLVIAHYILVCGVVASFFLLPFLAEWFIALPLMVFIWFFSTSPVKCKLTELENYLRRKMDMPEIKGFVSHYFKKPFLRLVSWFHGI